MQNTTVISWSEECPNCWRIRSGSVLTGMANSERSASSPARPARMSEQMPMYRWGMSGLRWRAHSRIVWPIKAMEGTR